MAPHRQVAPGELAEARLDARTAGASVSDADSAVARGTALRAYTRVATGVPLLLAESLPAGR